MSNPVTPLDNQAAIAQMGKELRATIGLLINEFIRPNSVALAETRAICDSNARSIAAEGDRVRELRESVEILRQSSDDTAAEASERDKTVNNHRAAITSLREAAITDRAEFRKQAEADRAVFREEMQAAREQSDSRFAAMTQKLDEQGNRLDRALDELAAQRESMRALLSALATNQSAVASLGDRVDRLEAS